MTNILLCGGSGTRLWPLSRELMPKQFLKLFDNTSLFQKTVLRNEPLCDATVVVANKEHYFLALDALEEVGREARFILEPFGRNTMAAVAFGAMAVDPQEVLLVTPSDHLVSQQKEYQEAVAHARELALQGYLVTFGIKPHTPHTGYGYIHSKGEDVLGFYEKPEAKRAQEFLHNPDFFWNSGIFCFQAKTLLDELRHLRPNLYNQISEAFKNAKGSDVLRIGSKEMEQIEDISIDYAIFEKSKRVKMVPAAFDWSDLGSFDELSKVLPSDNKVEVAAKDNFVKADKTVCFVGVEDLIVIDTDDALLVLKKGEGQRVKELVKTLKRRELLRLHKKVHRPWGSYEVLKEGEGYKIKRIFVKPGKRLSLQKHYHRNEHWIVLSGTALVEVEGKRFYLRPNESTYIKAGELHRLANPGKLPVVLLEAQVGEYVQEDDIVRVEDDFKRE